jgi:hypothetical protein
VTYPGSMVGANAAHDSHLAVGYEKLVFHATVDTSVVVHI